MLAASRPAARPSRHQLFNRPAGVFVLPTRPYSREWKYGSQLGSSELRTVGGDRRRRLWEGVQSQGAGGETAPPGGEEVICPRGRVCQRHTFLHDPRGGAAAQDEPL